MMNMPEKRELDWLAPILDQIDYGILLVDERGQALHVNRAARCVLDAGTAIRLRNGIVDAVRAPDSVTLHRALQAAIHRGLRTLVPLGGIDDRCYLSVIPLEAAGAGDRGTALLVAGRRDVSETLSAQGYARSFGLTTTECQVLRLLCIGAQANEIARRQGVAVSTIRTQIGSIRAKTGARSVGALVRQVALLPPMAGVLQAPAALPGAHA